MTTRGKRRRNVGRRMVKGVHSGTEAPPFEVGDREVVSRAQHLLNTWQLRMPALDVWKELEALRLEAQAQRQWPDWCWIPSAVTSLWVFRRTTAGARVNATFEDLKAWELDSTVPQVERSGHALAAAQLAAAASWRVTRGIYRVDRDLRRALLQTPVDQIAPEVLLRLPEWCPYIDLDSGVQLPDARAIGFYAHLDPHPSAPEVAVLQLLIVIEKEAPRRIVWRPIHLPLLHRSLREAWEHVGLIVKGGDEVFGAGYEQGRETYWESGLQLCLPFLLYLASQEPDVRHRHDPDRRPERKAPERQAGGTNWWEVGYRVGAALRHRTAEETETRAGSEGRSPAPHVRRAHYHLYWTGPGRQEPRIRWLHPLLVGDREGRELPPTIRRVEPSRSE